MRLVETRFGMKYLDSALLLDRNVANHPKQAGEIAERIGVQLATVRKSEAALFVGVGTFRSEELTPRWNWISDELTAAVEQHLVMSPSVVLLERHRTRPLMDERMLVAGLPEALRASAVFIDGSFRLERSKGSDAVSVTVCGHSRGKRVFVVSVDGSLDDMPLLVEQVVRAISEGLHTKLADTPADRRKEAKILLDEAKSFIAFKDYDRAITLLEAAVAVDPDAIEASNLLLQLAIMLATDPKMGLGVIKSDLRESYKRDIIPLLLNSLEIARRIIQDRISYVNGPYQQSKSYKITMWQMREIFRYPTVVARRMGKGDDTLEILETLRDVLAELHPLYVEKVKYYDKILHALATEDAVTIGFWWCYSVEEYLDNVKSSLELAVGQEPRYWATVLVECYPFAYNDCFFWAGQRGNAEQGLNVLRWMSNHDSPLLRACAHQCFVYHYAHSRPNEASVHYRAFVDLLEKEVIPDLPKWGHETGRWINYVNTNGRGSIAVDGEEIAQSNARTIRKVLQYSPQFYMGTWRDYVHKTYTLLDKYGRTREAADMLTACINKLEKDPKVRMERIETLRSWLRKLKEDHPELNVEVDLIPGRECTPTVLLHKKDVSYLFRRHGMSPENTDFRRLIIDGRTIAVICVSNIHGGARCGVLRLDPDTLTVVSLTAFEEDIPISTGRNANLRWFYSQHGPVVAAAEGTVYAAFPNGGVVVLPHAGKSKRLHESNGLASNLISHMDAMNGRLYAVTGYLFEKGLIEINPEDGTSRILISPRARENAHALDGSDIHAVASDSITKRLLVTVTPPDHDLQGLHDFDPASGDASLVLEGIVSPWYGGWMKRESRYVYLNTYHRLYLMDLTEQTTRLLVQYGVEKSSGGPESHWQTILNIHEFAVDGNALIGTAKDEGGQDHVVEFCHDRTGPLRLFGPALPTAKEIRDLGSTSKGMVILTTEALYLLSDGEEKKQ